MRGAGKYRKCKRQWNPNTTGSLHEGNSQAAKNDSGSVTVSDAMYMDPSWKDFGPSSLGHLA